MYESPIELIFNPIEPKIQQIAKKMADDQEQQIIEAVMSCGVRVDKDELVKALHYDRDQYNKGFRDGAIAMAESVKAKQKGFAFPYVEVTVKYIDDLVKKFILSDPLAIEAELKEKEMFGDVK